MRIDAKDRLILALTALLRAERETRAALALVVGNGQLDPAVLTAILTDPVTLITHEDAARAELLVAQPAGTARRQEAA